MLVMLAIYGPGRWSADHALARLDWLYRPRRVAGLKTHTPMPNSLDLQRPQHRAVTR
jgi:hypothetical protein